MLGVLNSLKAAPLAASTAAVTTFRCGLLRAVRGYSSDIPSLPAKETGGDVPILDENMDVFELEDILYDNFYRREPNVDLVIQYLSQDTMSRAELVKEELARVRENFKMHQYDTGSTSVQVAALTAKIKSMTEHVTQHRKDHSSMRGLTGMLNQRYKLLKYVRRTDPDTYQDLITRLGLRDRSYVGSRYVVQ